MSVHEEWLMRPVRCVPGRLDTPCILWTGSKRPNGYGQIRWGQMRQVPPVHRVTFYLYNGYWPNICRHRCDVRLCINPLHLQDGTKADNSRDMVERGRNRRGEAHHTSKWNDDTIRHIRRLRADGLSLSRISAETKVPYGTVAHIVRGDTWSHVS